tara:strand:+ start:73 stop:1038 length:966 start_codon:yes stop_codon:yes gene_type:complete
MKIFLSIASYQDPLLRYTIDSAFRNAKYKKDLVFGVFDQSLQKLDFNHSFINMRYKTCDPEDARGVCYARSKIQTDLYDNEEIYMQIDSHTIFDASWDEYLLNEYEKANDWLINPLITGYPRGFEVIIANDQYVDCPQEYLFKKSFDISHESTIVMIVKTPFTSDRFCAIEGHAINPCKQYRGFFISGGFIFTSGNFVNDVPYDPEIYFMGEEQTLALRAYTQGYDIVHVPNTPLYHWYNTEQNELKRPLHWEGKSKMSQEEIDAGFTRAMHVLKGKDFSKYGLGKKRTTFSYEKLSGIDYVHKRIAPDKAMTFNEYKEKT